MSALNSVGPKARPDPAALLPGLKDANPARRSAAARAVLAIDPAHQAARDALVELAFSDWDAQRGNFDRQLLLQLKPVPKAAVDRLLKQLDDPNYGTWYPAAGAFTQMQALEPESAPTLIVAAKKTKRAIVWMFLLPAIGRAADGSKEAIAFLAEQAKAGPQPERFTADFTSKVAPAPGGMRLDTAARLDLAAVQGLGQAGPAAKEQAVPILKPALKSPTPFERREAGCHQIGREKLGQR